MATATTSSGEGGVNPVIPEVKPTPAKPEVSTVQHKKADVIITRGKEQNETFSVKKETEQTLTETVQHFFLTFTEPPNPNASTGLHDWQDKFVKYFRQRYPDANKDTITKHALEFVQTTDGLQFALKLMEWELATLQMATRARIARGKKPEVLPYSPQLQTEGKTVTPVEWKKTGLFGLGRKIPVTPLAIDQIQTQEARAAEEKQDTSFYYKIEFLPGATNYYLLDDSQKAYLERNFLTGRFYYPTKNEDKREISRRLDVISRARIDFYTATGKERGSINLNAIELDQATGNIRYRNRLQERFLLIEQTSPSGSSLDAIGAEMKIVQDKLTARLTETNKQEERDLALHQIEVQKTKLQSEMSEEEKVKERGRVDTEIENLKKQREIVSQREEFERRKKELNAQIRDIEKLLGTETEIKAYGGAKEAYDKAVAQDPQSRAELEQIRDALQSLGNPNFRREVTDPSGNKTSEPIDEVKPHIKEYTERMKILIGEIRANSESIRNLRAELDKAEQELGKQSREKNVENYNLLQQRKQELKSQKVQETRFTTQHKTELQTLKTTSTKNLDSQIAGKEKAKEGVGKPDQWMELKREAYETFGGLLQNYDAIQGRAIKMDLELLEFRSDYRYREGIIYPKPYLQVIGILFGQDVLLAGREQEFLRATRLLTPEVFFPILIANQGADINAITKVEQKTMNDVLNGLTTKAIDGNLGEVDPNTRREIDSFNGIPPKQGINFSDPAINMRIENTLQGWYHYLNVNDLAVKMMRSYSLTDKEEALAYAIEVDRRRKELFSK